MTDDDLVKLYRTGATLEEVANAAGLTREGVRNRLRRLNEPVRTSKHTHELRFHTLTSGREEEIVDAFLRLRADDAVATELDLPAEYVRRIVDDRVPDARVIRKKRVHQTPNFTDDEIVESLRVAAATQQRNLAKDHYDAWWKKNRRSPDGRARPSWQTVPLRFGSWRAGLDAARLPANPHGGPTKRYDFDDAVAAIVDCWQVVGRPPTVADYDSWSPRPVDRPSSATVRKWGSWDELKVDAWQVIHGTALPHQAPLANGHPNLTVVPNRGVGEAYRPANEEALIQGPMAIDFDPAASERALSSHGALQNAIAEALRTRGLGPLSPRVGEPEYDLAFMASDALWVVEVKSTTPQTIERQLRLGLGQVLRYSEQLRGLDCEVSSVLAFQGDLPDDSWDELLRRLDVAPVRSESVTGDLDLLLG